MKPFLFVFYFLWFSRRLQSANALPSFPVSPPRAVLGGFLELEGGAGQGVPRQRPGGRGVHRACRHRVAGSCRGEERGGTCACLEEEVPGTHRETHGG